MYIVFEQSQLSPKSRLLSEAVLGPVDKSVSIWDISDWKDLYTNERQEDNKTSKKEA